MKDFKVKTKCRSDPYVSCLLNFMFLKRVTPFLSKKQSRYFAGFVLKSAVIHSRNVTVRQY